MKLRSLNRSVFSQSTTTGVSSGSNSSSTSSSSSRPVFYSPNTMRDGGGRGWGSPAKYSYNGQQQMSPPSPAPNSGSRTMLLHQVRLNLFLLRYVFFNKLISFPSQFSSSDAGGGFGSNTPHQHLQHQSPSRQHNYNKRDRGKDPPFPPPPFGQQQRGQVTSGSLRGPRRGGGGGGTERNLYV